LPPPGPPPNVLLMVIDCLRADRLSSSGYERPTTPNLDAIAAEGVSFERAFSQASWTRPSLPTILTGLYPAEHNLQDFLQGAGEAVMSPRLAASVVTLPEALGARGYRTALVGEQVQLDRRFGLDQGFDFYRNHVGVAANVHTLFERWLGRGDGRPFFAYLHYLDIHWPYCPPQDVRGTFYSGDSRMGTCGGWRKLRAQLQSGEIVPDEDDIEAMRSRYDEELLALDRQVGLLVAELKARGVWDDTLVVVTSDHGEQFFEHGGTGHGIDLYEELIAVPLIFKPPASWPVHRGSRVSWPVENRDILPTVLEAVGAPPPATSAPSLLPWMRRRPPAEPPHRYVISETGTQVAVRTADFKLIADRDGGGATLYALDDDPGEHHPVENRRKLAELRGYLREWQAGLKPTGAQPAEQVDEKTVEELKALGYLND
jgi:arylsulfatase A-like enzyme